MFRDNAPAHRRDRPDSFGNRGAFFQSAGLGGQLIGQSGQECKLRHAGILVTTVIHKDAPGGLRVVSEVELYDVRSKK